MTPETPKQIDKPRKISNKEQKYLSWQRSDITWRQFYESMYDNCHWMGTTQYGGNWLDKPMNEPILNITGKL